MLVKQYISALTALISLSSASLSPAVAPNLNQLRQTHRVTQVEGGRKLPGPVALANAFIKYRKPVPPAVARAANIAMADFDAAAVGAPLATTTTKKSTSTSKTSSATVQTASVVATDLPNDQAYYVNVTVGSTKMLLNFDTGSSDLWVFSTLLPASQRGTHKLYPLSGTNIDETFDISYGEGTTAEGVVYADKVAIGGVTATVQAVEAATSVSARFTTDLFDGLVGFGLQEGNTCSPNSCYGFMHQAGPNLPKNVLVAILKHNAPGIYDIGFIDSSKYTGSLVYTNVQDIQGVGYWEFLATGYQIGTSAQVVGQKDSIADTGTSLMLVDDDIVSAYYGAISGAVYNSTYAAYIFPCKSTLPTFSLYIEGVKRTMPAAYGIYGTLSSPPGYCYGGIQSNSGSGLNIFGDVFLKSQFVVFDYCLLRIGWAQQAGVTA